MISQDEESIRPLPSRDIHLAISLYTFNKQKPRHGWQLRAGGGTQSVRYKIRGPEGYFQTSSTYSGGDGNYFLNLNKTYNFDLPGKIHALLSAGPILLLNRYTNPTDSLKQLNYHEFHSYNLRAFGAGLYASANLFVPLTVKTNLMLSFSYQRGFVKHREVRIINTTRTDEAIFHYYGSGAGVMIGVLFNISGKENSKPTAPK